MKKVVSRFLEACALRNRKFITVYSKLGRPTGVEYAKVLRKHRLFYRMGDNCSIIPGTYIGDAKYISLGDNVRLANCMLLAHDGVVNMLNEAYAVRLDAVGKIVVGNNVFIGQDAKVFRNITVGDYCVVAAGAVVTKDVPSNSVVAGVPAKIIGKTDQLFEKLRVENERLPWADSIKNRDAAYDASIEQELYEQRILHYFGK